MKAREYTKRVEIWQTSIVSDGYGGSTISETLITSSWAKVETPSAKQVTLITELGITDPANTIIIKLRNRNDITYNAINQFIKYRGAKYVIQNAPVNVNFNDVDIHIIATREQTTSVSTLNQIT